ncbi:hypothetical protein M2194_003444 [Bradyrhizobium elkanii]|nr:hypothetical protein [Bradyrhizobium elkanii]
MAGRGEDAKAHHGHPFDGHTLGPVVADMEKLTSVEVRRIHVDKGTAPQPPHRFRVWISGQVHRVTASIRRKMKRRAAIEPVISHLKAGHRMDRNYLKGRVGDRINAAVARQKMAARSFVHATYLTKPESLYMWLALPRRWTQPSFVAAAAEAGVLVRSASMFALDKASSPQVIRIVLGEPKTRASLGEALMALRPHVNESR